MSILRNAAALMASGIVLVGCGAGQNNPAETLESAYKSIAHSQFEDLCELIDPGLAAALARMAGSCQAAMASDYSVEERAALADVSVREDLIEVHGDVARVAQGAINPSGPVTTFKMLVRHDGKWWIAR